MNAAPYTKELTVATDLARSVGQYLRAAQQANSIVKQPHGEGFLDVTTRADLEAERMILETLAQEFPLDPILSEETRTEYSSEWERTWIIDPLDGTTNYVKGLDAYAVSITLAIRGEIVLAVAYIPVSTDLIYAIQGKGVFHNGVALKLATPSDTLAQSLVSAGFPHLRTPEVAEKAFGLYSRFWLAASDLRRSASAVCDGCLLARGITGAYLTPDIKPWDIAAAVLFIKEQGGVVSALDGQPLALFHKIDGRFSTSALFAKNEGLHAEAVRIARAYLDIKK